MSEPNVGLFFGAGAEVDYGMPLGGSFALDVFRRDASPDKERLRRQLEAVDRTTPYGQWLPDRDRIWSFGKREAGDLLESTIENKKDDLLEFLATFESRAESFLADGPIDAERYGDSIERLAGRPLGEFRFDDIRLNDIFTETDGANLFASDHFSALLAAVEANDAPEIRDAVMAFVELLVACHGEDVVRRLNLTVFEETRGLDFLDDLPRMFRFEMESVARDALSLVFESPHEAPDADASDREVVTAFAVGMLEKLLAEHLDYRALIDEHFRYLFTPEAHWAKFTRIATFLFTVRRYVVERQPDPAVVREGPGYYHDLPDLEEHGARIHAVGTSNYNTFLGEIIGRGPVEPERVSHLNGGLTDFYDPYRNELHDVADDDAIDDQPHILVPFMLTQSGTKPMTSVEMSSRYVDLYRAFRRCDVVAAVGFGFNADDSHINGLFRSLAAEGTRIVVFEYADSTELSDLRRRERRRQLRMNASDPVSLYPVDGGRTSAGAPWWRRLLDEVA